MKTPQQPGTKTQQGPASAPRQAEVANPDAIFVDNRAETAAVRSMADAVSNSPRIVAQRKQLEMIGAVPQLRADPGVAQLNVANQIAKEQMAARVQGRKEQAADLATGAGTKGFGVRAIAGKDESKKLMNPAIKAGSSVDDVLGMVNAKGGPQEEYAEIMKGFESVPGVEKVIVAKPKNKESTERKIKDDYSGKEDAAAGTAGIQRMVDLVRGSVVVKGIEDLPAAFDAIQKAFTTKSDDGLSEVVGLIKVKNNFAAANKIANRDMNLTVELPKNKMYCEIQIHVKAFEDNKNRKKNDDKSLIKDDNDRKGWAFHGHIYYEASRVIKVEKGKPPEGVADAIGILDHAYEADEMQERSDAAFKNLTPTETLMSQVDEAVRKVDLAPDESDREHHWARIFKDLLMEHQAKQSQSLMLAEVMKSDPAMAARKTMAEAAG